MPYYHDPATQTVYAFPDRPEVEPYTLNPKIRPKRYDSWKVKAKIEITRADNYLKPEGGWFYRRFEHRKQTYPIAVGKSEAEVAFRGEHMAVQKGWVEIGQDEYERLKARYEVG